MQGLAADDVKDITLGWQANMKAVEAYILSKKACEKSETTRKLPLYSITF